MANEQDGYDPKMLSLPFSFALVKPDTVLEPDRLNAILKFIEDSHELRIQNSLQRELTKEEAMNLLYKQVGKPFYDEHLSYLLSGQCFVMVLCNAEGKTGDPVAKWKKLIGPMSPEDAKKTQPDSLRAKYGKTIVRNELWGSDNQSEANKQRKIFKFHVPQVAPELKEDPYRITFESMRQFLHPPNLEHACINQRMDVFALYGPIVKWHSVEQCFCSICRPIVRDKVQELKIREKLKMLKILKETELNQISEQFCAKCQAHCSSFTHLVGGRDMQHILTDQEIKELVHEMNKKDLVEMLSIEKGSTAKIMIEKIPLQQPAQIVYSMDLFRLLLQPLETDYYHRYSFTELQNVILEDRRIRITYWVSKVTGRSVERFPPVTSLNNTLTADQLSDPKSPFYTMKRNLPLTLLVKPELLKTVSLDYPPSVIDKKKLYPVEENIAVERNLHRNLTKVVTVGSKTQGVRQAVALLRPYNEGRHGDWDNYSTLKGTQKKQQVGGRNMASHLNQS